MKINNIELQDGWRVCDDVGYVKILSDNAIPSDLIYIFRREENNWNVRFFEKLYYLQKIWDEINNTSIIYGEENYVKEEVDKFLIKMSKLKSFI